MANPTRTTPSTSTSTSTPRPRPSEEIIRLENEIKSLLLGGNEMTKRLVRNVLSLQSERLGCKSGTWDEIQKRMDWGPLLGFARRILEVIPQAIARLEDKRLTQIGRVLVAWQATVGVVISFRESLDQVFSREEHRIASAIRNFPEAAAAFDEDRRRARPAPRPQPSPRPQGPSLDTLLTKGKPVETQAASASPRGQRGGNRGHGPGKGGGNNRPSQPKPAPQAHASRPAAEDDDRQPTGVSHEVSSFVTSLEDGGRARKLA